MANPTTLPGDLIVAGTARITGGISPTLARTSVLAVTSQQPFNIPWESFRIHDDSTNAALPGTAATDDLALIPGTFGSASPTIQGVDFGGTSTTAYARARVEMPWNYVDGNTVKFRFHAGMLTTVADDYARLDLEVYETDEEAGISADICATGVQSINSLTLADIDFTVTATNLAAGDLLDIRITVTGNDAGNLGVMIPVIGAAKLLCDVR